MKSRLKKEGKTWTVVLNNVVVGFIVFSNPQPYSKVKLKVILEYGIRYNTVLFSPLHELGAYCYDD